MSTLPLQQISEQEPTGSDVSTPTTTEAAEDNKPVTEEKPNTSDSENQQDTGEPQTEVQGGDTEPEVIKKDVCLWWQCLHFWPCLL